MTLEHLSSAARWFSLIQTHGMGSSCLRLLMDRFETSENIFRASCEELRALEFSEQLISEIMHGKKAFHHWYTFIAEQAHGYNVITYEHPQYPWLLKNIFDPPCVLFMQGEANILNTHTLAVVGSRRPTDYGKLVLERVIGALSRAGLTIVSGLAYGIDALSHALTIRSQGNTIAVLGSGLRKIYPRANEPLARDILKHGGLVVSELLPNAHATRYTFPLRNRIIAGLSKATVIIEASEKSGSLITARCALENGRDVYAVPGNIFHRQSQGTHMLLKNGAYPLTDYSDIFSSFPHIKTVKQETVKTGLTCREQQIYDILKTEGILDTETLSKKSGMPIDVFNHCLTMLELNGSLVRKGDNCTVGSKS